MFLVPLTFLNSYTFCVLVQRNSITILFPRVILVSFHHLLQIKLVENTTIVPAYMKPEITIFLNLFSSIYYVGSVIT